MKKMLFCAVMAAACVLVGAEKKDYSNYLKVSTNQGGVSKLWTMTSSYASPTIKTLNLEIDPAEVKAAAIEYDLTNDPYDARLKQYIKKQDHNWADMVVTVNGKEVYKGHAGPIIAPAGTHRLDIDPKVLKAGDNVIKFVYIRRKPGDTRVYGYTYFAVDRSERELARRKLPKNKQGKPHNDDIRIRLLVSL